MSNREAAELARSTPDVWVSVARGMANANKVTSLRQGHDPELDPRHFEFRSRSRMEGDRRVYDIEARTRSEELPLDVDALVRDIIEEIRPGIRAAVMRSIGALK